MHFHASTDRVVGRKRPIGFRQILFERRTGEAGLNKRNSNSECAQFVIEQFRIAFESMLGRCIERVVGGRDQAHNRTHIDDPPLPLTPHRWQHRVGHAENAEDVHVEQRLSLRGGGDREAILAAIAGEGFAKLGPSFLRAVDQAGAEPVKALEAIGRAYVGFALRHPAYFQAMFRADAVPLDRYPDVRKLSDEAFGKLVETIGKMFADQPSAVRLTISVACWAMVHGLATLILEGTLARTIEVPRARQRQVANEVIETFTSLFIKDRM